jgi:hypothetical protein
MMTSNTMLDRASHHLLTMTVNEPGHRPSPGAPPGSQMMA